MLNKVLEYRWELWLFIGVPVLAWAVQELFLLYVFENLPGIPLTFWDLYSFEASPFFWNYVPGFFVALCLVAGSYRWVRRMDRPVLVVVWQHSIALQIVALVFLLARTGLLSVVLLDEGAPLPWRARFVFLHWMQIVIDCVLLVWFARKVSRQGFRKALSFMGIGVFPGVVFPSLYQLYWYWGQDELYTDFPESAIAAVLGLALSVIVVHAAHRADLDNALGNKALAVLFGTGVVAWALFYMPEFMQWGNDVEWELGVLTEVVWGVALVALLPQAAGYGLAIAVAYVLRLRLPKPQREERQKPEEFVGLYRRKA